MRKKGANPLFQYLASWQGPMGGWPRPGSERVKKRNIRKTKIVKKLTLKMFTSFNFLVNINFVYNSKFW